MKRLKMILYSLLLTAIVSFPIFAAEAIDVDREVNLTLNYQDKERALSGAKFSLYQIAQADAFGTLTVTEAFEPFSVDIDGKQEEDWGKLALTLESYVLRDKLTPLDEGKTDDIGMLYFPTAEEKLSPGLYLVLGTRYKKYSNIYDTAPFLVMLPEQDLEKNEWVYGITASPKYTVDRDSGGSGSSGGSDKPSTPGKPDGAKPDDITCRVVKVWDDAEVEDYRPEEIWVELLQDGELYDTVALSEENNWRYEWNELSNESRWTVAEEELENYRMSLEQNGNTFVMTNTPTQEFLAYAVPLSHRLAGLPQTGLLWWPIPVFLLIGVTLIMLGLIRRRGEQR